MTPLHLYLMLKERSSAEISGRLLSRAEAFEKLDTDDPFYRRCAVLDIHTGESTLHSDKIAIVGLVMHASGAGLIGVSLGTLILKHLP